MSRQSVSPEFLPELLALVRPDQSEVLGSLGAGRRARHQSNMLEFQMECVCVCVGVGMEGGLFRHSDRKSGVVDERKKKRKR